MMWLALLLFGIACFGLGFMVGILLMAAELDSARYYDEGDLS